MSPKLATLAVSTALAFGLLAPPLATAESEPGRESVTELDRFYSQQLEWESCADFADAGTRISGVDGAQCAFVEVPLDYANPAGRVASIALSRLPASGEKIGSLVILPGGPGQAGLDLAAVGQDTVIAERFDRIGFDPRGIGASTPSIDCLTDSERDADRGDTDVDFSPEGVAQIEAEVHDYVAKCVERTGVDVLANIGTRDVARDLDIVRAVLGDERLTAYGGSYGTRIGGEYADRFPDRVRALVLDGAVDPSQDTTAFVVDQNAGFQLAFDTYAAACATDSTCPLGVDPAAATATFRSLVEPLIDRPAVTEDPRGLSYYDAIAAVQSAMYYDGYWEYLTVGLDQLAQGRGDVLLLLADEYYGRSDNGMYEGLDFDGLVTVRCVDDSRITDRGLAAELDRRIREVAPAFSFGPATGYAPLDPCAFWPVEPTSVPHEYVAAGLPEVVVVSTTGDPATPYEAGVELARQLRASLITYEANQHTAVFGGVPCVDDAVYSYLIDLTPPGDIVC